MPRARATAWAKDNIQVNAVLPGWIDTDLTRRAREQVTRLHVAAGARLTTWRRSRYSWRPQLRICHRHGNTRRWQVFDRNVENPRRGHDGLRPAPYHKHALAQPVTEERVDPAGCPHHDPFQILI